jgi:hypothetical protein
MDAAADMDVIMKHAVGGATAHGTATATTVNIAARKSATGVTEQFAKPCGATDGGLPLRDELFINSMNQKGAENLRAFYCCCCT